MTITLTCVLLLFLSCQLTLGARTNLFLSHQHGKSPVALASDEGICESRVTIYGYACEEHDVTTEDGYYLTMQRIPTGRDGKTTGDRIPVLLQHGLFMNGITWLLNSPDESLAFILADSGYDVWIANTRGTKYSRAHTSFSPDDRAYWGWTWDELVSFELPANVQYVHEKTGQKLHYVGHCLGSLIALASLSLKNELDMFRSAALLSPIAYLYQVPSPLVQSVADNLVKEEVYWLGVGEFDPKGQAVEKLLKVVCENPDVDCDDLLTSFTGKNCCLNSSSVDVFIENGPQSSSAMNLIHITQMIRGRTISKFDYITERENMMFYGQTTPPAYNMTNIPNDFPLFLSYGGADAFSVVNDVQILLTSLKDHDEDKLVVQYREDYAHADFVMGVNAKQVVYDPLIAFFKLQ